MATLVIAVSAGCKQRETPSRLLEQLNLLQRGAPATQPPAPDAPAFIPYAYSADDADTPFGRAEFAEADANARPPQRGPMQYLENFPLESIRMVGTLARDGRLLALLQVDKVVHQSHPGDYVGKNFGVIRHIAETGIELEELVRAADDWERRPAKLELQGTGK